MARKGSRGRRRNIEKKDEFEIYREFLKERAAEREKLNIIAMGLKVFRKNPSAFPDVDPAEMERQLKKLSGSDKHLVAQRAQRHDIWNRKKRPAYEYLDEKLPAEVSELMELFSGMATATVPFLIKGRVKRLKVLDRHCTPEVIRRQAAEYGTSYLRSPMTAVINKFHLWSSLEEVDLMLDEESMPGCLPSTKDVAIVATGLFLPEECRRDSLGSDHPFTLTDILDLLSDTERTVYFFDISEGQQFPDSAAITWISTQIENASTSWHISDIQGSRESIVGTLVNR